MCHFIQMYTFVKRWSFLVSVHFGNWSNSLSMPSNANLPQYHAQSNLEKSRELSRG
jgi:hypothetical protein